MAKNRSIKKRQLLILNHLFDEIYLEPQVDSVHFITYPRNTLEGATYNDYYRLVSKDKCDYGNKPIPKFIRFNDVLGIQYKINNDIRQWKERLPNFIAGGISADDLEEIEYDTLAIEMKNLVDRDHVLVRTGKNNIKGKCFYFPNETVEGYNHLLEYLLLLPYGPSDDFGIQCRELAFSNYSKIVLNREYVIQNMRKKGMQMRMGLANYFPYLGHYRKIFECPKALDKLVSICSELKNLLPEFKCTDTFGPGKTTHEVVDDLIGEAKTYLSRIADIQSALSEVEQKEDQLARLHPRDWFVLDPDSKLRREAQWSVLTLSQNEMKILLDAYSKYCCKKQSEITIEEWNSFIQRYINGVEMDVLYTLSMISNSYWALMYFHLHRHDNFFEMETKGTNPYERLPGPSVANRTGNYGMDDIFWDKQLYRFAMYDYALGTYTKHPNGPALMGIGPISYEGEIIPTTFSFRVTPNCYLTAFGLLNRDDDSNYPLDKMENASTHKGIEKKVYGNYYSQSYLLSMFELPHMYENNLDDVLKQLMLDIDCDGNCQYGAQHYLNLFKDERPEYKKNRGW